MAESLPIVRTVADLRAQVAAWRADGARIGFVPTMGALHAGHLELVAEGRRRADKVVASIFVNPRQFGPNEDFDRYPRDEGSDAAKLAGAGADLLFAPDVAAMYPDGFATAIRVDGLGDRLCGAARPGHFDGVGIVVAKLLNQVAPDVALFGEKDWQQLAIIRRLVADLDLAIEIVGVPIVRDPDGLALSSRNLYLSAGERARALELPRALAGAASALASGAPVSDALAMAFAQIAAAFDSVDYVELTGADDLQPLDRLDRPARLLAAARIGKTRLIDNIAVTPR